MNLQHINFKIFAEKQDISLDELIPVFHRWIQNKVTEEMLIDVADYAHVPEGPGILLIGHEANISIDNAENRLGLLYNRKTVMEGSTQDKLQKVMQLALQHCKRLEEEPTLSGKLKFNAGSLQLIINDRLLAPNTDETLKILEPELKNFLSQLYQKVPYTLTRHSDSRERFTLDIQAKKSFEVSSLLQKLK